MSCVQLGGIFRTPCPLQGPSPGQKRDIRAECRATAIPLLPLLLERVKKPSCPPALLTQAPASLLQLKSTCKPDALAQPRPQAQAGKHSSSKSMATGKMFKRRYL